MWKQVLYELSLMTSLKQAVITGFMNLGNFLFIKPMSVGVIRLI